LSILHYQTPKIIFVLFPFILAKGSCERKWASFYKRSR